LVIYGDGPQETELRALVAHLGLSDRVDFAGWTESPLDAVLDIDCLLLPSFSEGTPRSILEAASVGVPAIATRVGGIPDIVSDGESGWLVPAGDVESLLSVMEIVIQDPSLLTVAGAAARERMLSRLNANDEFEKVLANA
jgi:glycosyltransferase involved in cell wall biosynthesis